MAKDKDPSVRELIPKYTQEINAPDALNLLEEMTKDKSTDVRKEVVKTLEKMYSPKTPTHRYVDWSYVEVNKTLEKTNITKAMHLLEKLAKDLNKDVRILAIKAMGELNKN